MPGNKGNNRMQIRIPGWGRQVSGVKGQPTLIEHQESK